MNPLQSFRNFLTSRMGMDKAIAFTFSGRMIQAVGGFVTISLITIFLTKDEQGFYYTFGSILALQIFFELGFNGIITQYAAHETAHISGYERSNVATERQAQSRLASLLHFCIKWFGALSIGLLVILLVVGYVFFSTYGHGSHVTWKLPWAILVVNTSLSFLISPLLSFIEGLGHVKDVAKLRLIQQSVSPIILWILLSSGAKLYAVPIAGIVSILVIIIFLFVTQFRVLLTKIWYLSGEWKINYRKEIFPYQWKIALSWVSGYFIFQLFNPVLFATEGPAIAGKMGMTMTVLNGVSGITNSWISTKVPLFSKLFAQSDYKYADRLFSKTFKQVLVINFIGVLLVLFLVYALHAFHLAIADRFLPIPLIALLGLSIFLNQMSFSWATYLRCHKKEPFLINSVVNAILIGSSTVIFGYLYGVEGLVIGYVVVGGLLKIWTYSIFVHYKSMWHG